MWKVFSPSWPWPSLEGDIVCASTWGHASDFKPDQSCLQSENTPEKCAENNFPCKKKMVPSVKDDTINQNHPVTESSWPLSIHHTIPIRRGVYCSTNEHLIFTIKMRRLSHHSFNDPYTQHAAFYSFITGFIKLSRKKQVTIQSYVTFVPCKGKGNQQV